MMQLRRSKASKVMIESAERLQRASDALSRSCLKPEPKVRTVSVYEFMAYDARGLGFNEGAFGCRSGDPTASVAATGAANAELLVQASRSCPFTSPWGQSQAGCNPKF